MDIMDRILSLSRANLVGLIKQYNDYASKAFRTRADGRTLVTIETFFDNVFIWAANPLLPIGTRIQRIGSKTEQGTICEYDFRDNDPDNTETCNYQIRWDNGLLISVLRNFVEPMETAPVAAEPKDTMTCDMCHKDIPIEDLTWVADHKYCPDCDAEKVHDGQEHDDLGIYRCEDCKELTENTYTCITCGKEICWDCAYTDDGNYKCPKCHDAAENAAKPKTLKGEYQVTYYYQNIDYPYNSGEKRFEYYDSREEAMMVMNEINNGDTAVFNSATIDNESVPDAEKTFNCDMCGKQTDFADMVTLAHSRYCPKCDRTSIHDGQEHSELGIYKCEECGRMTESTSTCVVCGIEVCFECCYSDDVGARCSKCHDADEEDEEENQEVTSCGHEGKIHTCSNCGKKICYNCAYLDGDTLCPECLEKEIHRQCWFTLSTLANMPQ